MSKLFQVLYHDNCFDGIASAAVFTRFYRACVDGSAAIVYQGLAHRAGQNVDDGLLAGDENAIVDFKYSASDRLTWWFDHHESAFLSQDDERHFRRDTSGRKFHDSGFTSCTKFIASIGRNVFGFEAPDLTELIAWADLIDGAQFRDAKMAVELKEAPLQLMLVIEASRSKELLHRLIRDFQTRSLADVAADPEIRETFDRLYRHHLDSIDIVRKSATFKDGVIHFDVSPYGLDGYNKFIPYYLFPDAVYNVGVSKSDFRSKVSVGTNPWSAHARIHNLAKLCEEYGGGGHAVVAAISFKPEELNRARTAAHEIAAKLRRDLQEESKRG